VIRKSTKLWALALIMALVFIACGGGDDPEPAAESPAAEESSSDPAATTSTPEQYVTNLCTQLGSWITALQEGQQTVTESIQPGNIQSGIDALRAFFDSAVTATENLVAGIQSVGPPDVEGGEEISAEFTAQFEEAKAALEDARAQVDSLPADDPQAFQDAANDLSLTIQSQLNAVGDALSTLSQPELDQEATTNAACQQLQSAGS
jgi:hypothetical protein